VPTKGEAILEAKVQGEIDGSIFVLTNDLEHCEQVIRARQSHVNFRMVQ
jgi:hypothetical protein